MLLTVSVPAVLLATIGTVAAWRLTDLAVREKTRADALGLAEFVATSFGAVEETPPGTAPRIAHRAVTNAVRSNWSALQVVSDLRIVGRDGQVKWSREIEEEDKPFANASALLNVAEGRATFEAPSAWLPWSSGAGGEVLYPLGGVACGGCHTGESTMRVGVLALRVSEPKLRTEVARVFTNATWFVTLFVLTIAATVFIAVRVFVSRRVARLAAVMKRAEDGDVVVRAPDLGEDELGRLAHAFNRMLGRLTDLKVVEIDTQRDLETARTELELKTEVEKRVGELQILFELSRTIASTLDLEEVLHRVTSEVPGKLDVQKFSVMLLNAAGELEVLNAHPANVGSEGLTFAVGEGVCGHAARQRRRHYAPDLENEPLFKVKGEKVRGSLLSVPMVRGEELLGVLNFERSAPNAFPPADQDFFVAVADQIALAVQNARLHEHTLELSVTDPLTGVPNRRYLYQQLESELARASRFDSPLSMVMVDIDHFKLLNDTAGHSAGDDVLRKVAQLMKQNLRKVDTLARYGGEEFIVLLPQIDRTEAAEVAEKLRRAIAESGIEQGRTQPLGKVTISVGVATMPRDANDDVKLIDSADAALYASKRGGRNKVTSYEVGMELEPTRQRGRLARARTGETPMLVRDEK
ncbi:MAG: diguanylate cyclase [Archangium gephyra]|uniref:diguanylate cyclase n=1 Tax=Archangium gephyra TaxID=48 RepID=A0A2W5VIF9_9BACT|nr:MAG: diguanylate cyclase [Archangium gephyra]